MRMHIIGLLETKLGVRDAHIWRVRTVLFVLVSWADRLAGKSVSEMRYMGLFCVVWNVKAQLNQSMTVMKNSTAYILCFPFMSSFTVCFCMSLFVCLLFTVCCRAFHMLLMKDNLLTYYL